MFARHGWTTTLTTVALMYTREMGRTVDFLILASTHVFWALPKIYTIGPRQLVHIKCLARAKVTFAESKIRTKESSEKPRSFYGFVQLGITWKTLFFQNLGAWTFPRCHGKVITHTSAPLSQQLSWVWHRRGTDRFGVLSLDSGPLSYVQGDSA